MSHIPTCLVRACCAEILVPSTTAGQAVVGAVLVDEAKRVLAEFRQSIRKCWCVGVGVGDGVAVGGMGVGGSGVAVGGIGVGLGRAVAVEIGAESGVTVNSRLAGREGVGVGAATTSASEAVSSEPPSAARGRRAPLMRSDSPPTPLRAQATRHRRGPSRPQRPAPSATARAGSDQGRLRLSGRCASLAVPFFCVALRYRVACCLQYPKPDSAVT